MYFDLLPYFCATSFRIISNKGTVIKELVFRWFAQITRKSLLIATASLYGISREYRPWYAHVSIFLLITFLVSHLNTI